jgi:hypothetical protein
VHRFYDRSASTWTLGRPQPFSVETAAEDLLHLVLKVLAKTGAPGCTSWRTPWAD